MFTTAIAHQVVESFLSEVRSVVHENSWNPSRLPQWIQEANVRAGWVNDSLIMVFEESYGW